MDSRQEPGAAQVVIQTRWHEKDLAGAILEQKRARRPGAGTSSACSSGRRGRPYLPGHLHPGAGLARFGRGALP